MVDTDYILLGQSYKELVDINYIRDDSDKILK